MTEIKRPSAANFKLINGIGPAIEGRLHNAAIVTFSQLATMQPSQIAPLVADLNGMSAERIESQDWIGQSKILAAQEAQVTPTERQPIAISSGDRQHYATFKLELLLDEGNHVRRTHAAHVQGGRKATWAGWNEQQLVNFIKKHAVLDEASTMPALPESLRQETPVAHAPAAEHQTAMPSLRPDALRLNQVDAVSTLTHGPANMLKQSEPFGVRLSFDLGNVSFPEGAMLDYLAIIYAKHLAVRPGEVETAGEVRGTIDSNERVIEVPVKLLTPGAYRLQAKMKLGWAGQADLLAHHKGDLVHVH